MDPELEAIRQRRMAEIMAKQGGAGPMGMGGEDQEQQEEARRAAEEQRQTLLAAVLSAQARERLSRIALVKPEKARGVENMILAAAKRGQIGAKVSEEQLVQMLEQISEKEGKTKITIQRRRPAFDDDDY